MKETPVNDIDFIWKNDDRPCPNQRQVDHLIHGLRSLIHPGRTDKQIAATMNLVHLFAQTYLPDPYGEQFWAIAVERSLESQAIREELSKRLPDAQRQEIVLSHPNISWRSPRARAEEWGVSDLYTRIWGDGTGQTEPNHAYPGPAALWDSVEFARSLRNVTRSKKEMASLADFLNPTNEVILATRELDLVFKTLLNLTVDIGEIEKQLECAMALLTKPLEDYAYWGWGDSKEFKHKGAEHAWQLQKRLTSLRGLLAQEESKLDKKRFEILAALLDEALTALSVFKITSKIITNKVQERAAKKARAVARKEAAKKAQKELAKEPIIVDGYVIQSKEQDTTIYFNPVQLVAGLAKRKDLIDVFGIRVPVKTIRDWLTVCLQNPETGRRRRGIDEHDWIAARRSTLRGNKAIELTAELPIRVHSHLIDQVLSANTGDTVHKLETNLVESARFKNVWTPEELNKGVTLI